MRPVTLPHHRTCGFPHPAVGPSRGLPSLARSPVTPNTPTGWEPSAFGRSLVSPEWRPQLSRSAASFVLSSPVPAPRLALFDPSALRIETPFCSCVPPALLWPLLTPQHLSAPGSPRVSVGSVRSRLWALPAVASGSRASCLLAHSPPTAGLSAHLCSFGRALAFHPFVPAPCGDDLAVRLRLAPQAPGGNVSSRKSRHLPGTRAQSCTLLYRRFTACERLPRQGQPAECNSAIRLSATLRYRRRTTARAASGMKYPDLPSWCF